MNTQFFKYAIEVERTSSITKAAENLFMAQPNLSKAIKELEDTLGFVIFERNSKGVAPTANGRRFLQYAHNIMEQLNRMESIAIGCDGHSQMLKVSIPRVSYIARACNLFVAGLDGNKGIDVTIREANSMQTISGVAERRFNLGVIRYQTLYEQYFLDYLREKHLKYETVWEFEYVALLSKNHPLAKNISVEYSELKKYIEIMHGDTAVPYLQDGSSAGEPSAQSGVKRIAIYERANQFELLSTIPQTFMLVSPVPADILSRYDLVEVRCGFSGNRHKDLLVYPDGYRFSPADKALVNKLYEAKNSVAFREYYGERQTDANPTYG